MTFGRIIKGSGSREFFDQLRSLSLMEPTKLPYATWSVRPSKLFDSEHQAIALVFAKPSDRIPRSPNRAAIPVRPDDEGAVRRDIPGFRVLSFSLQVSLTVCLFVLQAVLPAAAQSTSDENKPKDEPKRYELKEVQKEDSRKDTAGTPFKPGGTIHFDVDLALVNVTVTDPYNRLVTGLETDNFRVFEDNIE